MDRLPSTPSSVGEMPVGFPFLMENATLDAVDNR